MQGDSPVNHGPLAGSCLRLRKRESRFICGSKLDLLSTGAALSYWTTEPWVKHPLEELGPHETRVSPPLESTSGCDPANIPEIDVKGKGAGVGTVGREVIRANR